jgi:alanyl aminopeptidase
MASKVIRDWKPEWNTKLDEQNTRTGAMNNDTLVSARQIRQPIEAIGDISNAFDNITYSKGEIVIGMFEGFMGEAAFQQGVQRYLRQYSWHSATAADFLDAVGSGGKSVSRPFSTFLNQPGVPLVSMQLNCDGASGASLRLSQKRALPIGSTGSAEHTWQVPVCARYGDGTNQYRDCTLLTDASTDWKLPQAKSCPTWVEGNADGKGYYLTRYEGNLLNELLADGGHRLPPNERVATLQDVVLLATTGDIKGGDALALVPEFAGDPVRQVVGSMIEITAGIRQNLVPADLMPNYTRFVAKNFGERARQLGWTAKPGEDSETRLVRTRIVPLVAVWGNDKELAAEAHQLAGKWLADRKSVDPDIVQAVLTVSARTGDEAFFKELAAALPSTEDRQQRDLLFSALGDFRDRQIQTQAMDLVLKPEYDLRESIGLLFGALSTPGLQKMPFEFVKTNYDAIVSRIPTGSTFGVGEFLPYTGNGLCDEQSAQEVNTFFAPKVNRFPGTERNLAQTLESIRLCSALKAAQEPSIETVLRKY